MIQEQFKVLGNKKTSSSLSLQNKTLKVKNYKTKIHKSILPHRVQTTENTFNNYILYFRPNLNILNKLKKKKNIYFSEFQINRAESQINRAESQINRTESQIKRAEYQVNRAESQINRAESQINRTESQINRTESQKTELNTRKTELKTLELWILRSMLNLLFSLISRLI